VESGFILTETAGRLNFRHLYQTYQGCKIWAVSVQCEPVSKMAKPLQRPHPPISVSLASPHSQSARSAAERGWDIVSANISPVYSVKSHWDIYIAERISHPSRLRNDLLCLKPFCSDSAQRHLLGFPARPTPDERHHRPKELTAKFALGDDRTNWPEGRCLGRLYADDRHGE
jgi:hypothetical protein